jgi:uncharacterized repeat protein (TIGR01451 family)
MSYFGILYAIRKLPLTLALTLAVGMPASAQDKGRITGATPLQPGTTYGVGKTGPAGAARAQAQAVTLDEKRVSIIVKLADEPLAAYKGGVGSLAPTSPAVTGARALDASSTASRQYLNYLSQRQAAFAAAAQAISGAEVRQRFDIVLGGVSMLVPETRLDAVRALPGVAAVYLDQLLQPDTNVSPQFIGAPAIWRALGGQDEAGEGVVVGVLDSGIWPEHPSVSDPDPAGNGYPLPPPTWAGAACEFGNIGHNPDDASFTCNNKLIGAQAFIETYKAVIGLLPTEFDSARDDNGHGTHTATTAAGNAGVDAEILGVHRGTISGIAPRAHLAAYKVCGDQGCFQSDTIGAVQQAILDGVDVINFSISGGSNPYADVVEQAFLDAYGAGVFVAASAGNSGPAADTVDHRGPWVTTVAASHTNRFFLSEVTLQAGGGATLRLIGASITDGIAVATPVVQAKDFDPSADNLCAEEFPTGTFSGQIVVCEVGTPPTRIEKGFNVLQGGASGMFIYNPTLQGIGTDNHHLPAVMLEVDRGQALLDFLESHSDVTATFTPGEAEKVKGDVMAAFSSRGGPGQTLGISKPDVTAPGVQIVAGHTPLAATVAGGPEGELFQAIRGTSMSSPHVAGAAALVVALHPDWTPGQVKSALMTSATTKVLKEDESTPANPFDFGAGRIDLRRAGGVGITFDVSAAEYVELEDELWNANYPSVYLPVMPGRLITTRVATNVLGKDVTYRLSAKSPRDLRITVPHKLKVPKSGEASFDITIDARNVPLGEVRHAAIFLEGRGHRLHLPVSLVRRQPPVTLEKSCEPLTFEEGQTTTCTITATNTAFDPAEVELTDKLPQELKLIKGSVTGATPTRNGLEFVGTLAPVVPSTVDIGEGPSPAGGYLPLSVFGIPPIAGVGDETITNFAVPAFEFASETYTSVGMVSNGYLVVGGGTGNDVQFVNQSLPNPTPPNNLLAPLWTDLNPGAGGAMRVGVLTDGTSDWIVFDWEAVPNFTDGEANSFQVWIGINGVQDITYAFGAVSDGDGGFLTVGAENRFGNRGGNFYFNGAGTAPAPDLQLAITSTPGGPGETKVVTFQAKGDDDGRFQNCAELTSPLFQGTNLACVDGRVTD